VGVDTWVVTATRDKSEGRILVRKRNQNDVEDVKRLYRSAPKMLLCPSYAQIVFA
jgi:hypothetical protein